MVLGVDLFMTFTKRGERGQGISDNFADICGWFWGMGYLSGSVGVHLYKK